MKPTSFKETNQVLLAGGNPETDQLPVAHSTHPEISNMPFVISKWKLTLEEIEKFKETGEFWVCIMGKTQPPMLLTVNNPFKELGYIPNEI